MKNPRILIVDDHYPVRQSLRIYLREIYPHAQIGEAHNGRQALDMVAADPPDVVLLDAIMPHVDGAEATREIKTQWPEVWVVALVLDVGQRDLLLEAGADAWVLKGRSSEELLAAVQALSLEPGDQE
jgi:NarL family two-component system response regulator LiaR